MARKKKTDHTPTPGAPRDGYVEFGLPALQSRLTLLRGIIPKRLVSKGMGCYHITMGPDGRATIGATSFEVSLLLELEPIAHSGAGTIRVVAHALDAFLGSYAEPKVRFHWAEADPTHVRVASDRSPNQYVLPALAPEDGVICVPGSLTQSGWLVCGDDLVRALIRTKFATDPESTHYALGSVCLEFPPCDGIALEVVATDGKRLALQRIPVRSVDDPGRGPTLLAGPAISPALRLARIAGRATVGLTVVPGEDGALDRVQVVTKTAVLTARIPDGRYPAFREVWPNVPVQAEILLKDATTLGSLVASAASATDAENRGVDFVLAEGRLTLTVHSETNGQANLVLPVPDASGQATFTLDALLFGSFFEVLGVEPITIQFFGPDLPLVLRTGSGYDGVIMPLRQERPAPEPEPEPAPAVPEPVSAATAAANGKARSNRRRRRRGKNGG